MNPILVKIDPYLGSIWAVIEAVSNFVSIGGDIQQAALIDNFIWPFPDEESLADLDKSVDACVDTAKILNMPFVSGKDSLSSTYRFPSGSILKIPPVVLISVFGRIPDISKTNSSDFKAAGSLIILAGEQDTESLGGSAYFDVIKAESSKVPKIDLKKTAQVFKAIHSAIQKEQILSCHDISEGGLAAAIAEMCIGGDCGAQLDVNKIANSKIDRILFNETAGTFLVEVQDLKTAQEIFKSMPYKIIGKTLKDKTIEILNDKKPIHKISVEKLKKAWQNPMKGIFT